MHILSARREFEVTLYKNLGGQTTLNDSSDAENLQTIHLKLQEVMRLELSLLREILSLMKEEENALLEQNKELHASLFSKRAELKQKVKNVQKIRRQATKKLFKDSTQTVDLHHFNSKIFDDLVAQDEENASETFSLREQILKIIQHIDAQKHRITKTFKGLSKKPAPALESSSEKHFPQALTTIDPGQEEDKE